MLQSLAIVEEVIVSINLVIKVKLHNFDKLSLIG